MASFGSSCLAERGALAQAERARLSAAHGTLDHSDRQRLAVRIGEQLDEVIPSLAGRCVGLYRPM